MTSIRFVQVWVYCNFVYHNTICTVYVMMECTQDELDIDFTCLIH